MKRRSFLQLAGIAALGTGLAACSSGNGGAQGGSKGPVSIRYGHWDNGAAQATYAKLFQQFMDENDDVNILQEFASFNDFQERITTQIAGKNLPHIFWIAATQVLTYEAADLYLDFDELPGFDLSEYDEDTIERIKINGNLNTMPMGMSIPVFRYNNTYLEDDGITLPSNWTFEALSEFLIDYSKENSHGVKGIHYVPAQDMVLENWLRQHDEDLWTEDGKLGASPEVLAEWIEWWEKLRNAGATMSIEEQGGVSPSWSEHGKKVLFTTGNQNHILEAAEVFPDIELKQLTVPTINSPAQGHSFAYFVRLAVYKHGSGDNLEAIAKLLNFNLNSADFMRELGPVMGSPVSKSQQAAANESTDPSVMEVMQITNETLSQPMRPRFDAPPGSSTWRIEFSREIEQVASGNKTSLEAMEDFHASVVRQIG